MSPLARFTPSLMSAAQLERLFVARQPTLERVMSRIGEASRSVTRNHTLLVGPRGAGKTHLVALAAHRTRALIEQRARLQLAWLAEDPWRITSYPRLLHAITQAVAVDIAAAQPQGTQLPVMDDAEEYEQHLVVEAEQNGPIVTVVENLDQVLEQIGRQGQQRLRHLLQDRHPLLLVATSTSLDRALSAQSAPLYGFFTTERLEPFTVKQALEMLTRIAGESGDSQLAEFLTTETAKSRVITTAHLAGGQPRLWALFASGLTIAQLTEFVDALLTRFDDLTPYYQERLARLAPQQRLVIAELADADRPLYVAQLAAKVGAAQRSVAKTVFELKNLGWVRETQSPAAVLLDRRRTYYELAEPLARLAFQLKEAHGTPIRLAVEFIKAWFEPRELRPTAGLVGRYINAAILASAGDHVGQVMRLLTGDGLPKSRAPAVRFAGQVDDALAALVDRDPEPYLSLPAAVRTAIDDDLESDRLAETASTARLRLQFELLGQLGFTDQALAESWVRRAEGLVAHGGLGNDRFKLVNLAEAYTKAGHLDEARGVMQAAGARGMPLIVAEVACKIAAGLRANGALHEAKILYQHALEAHSGPPFDEDDASHQLGIRNALASLRGELGDQGGAVADLRQILDQRLQMFGPNQHDTLATRQELAYWRAAAGDVKEAVAAYAQLLDDVTRVFGPQDRRTLATRGTLAYWQGNAGNYPDAVAALERLLQDDLELLGPDHPDTLTTRNNLAMLQGDSGNPEAAVQQLRRLVADRIRILGPSHPETLAARNNLGLWQGQAGDPIGAAGAYERLLADQTSILGPDHPDLLHTRNNLALMHGQAGDCVTAAAELERLLADEQHVFGADHPDTLITRGNLAVMHGEAGSVSRAVRELERLLTDEQRVLGPDHPFVTTTRDYLDAWKARPQRRAHRSAAHPRRRRT